MVGRHPPTRLNARAASAVFGLGVLLVVAVAAPAPARSWPVVTVLTDFEDDSVALGKRDYQNVRPSECIVAFNSLPARGRRSVRLEIAAVRAPAAFTAEFDFRQIPFFESMDKVSASFWIDRGAVDVALQLTDGSGRRFLTPSVTVSRRRRWLPSFFDIQVSALRAVRPGGELAEQPPGELQWPCTISGVRVTSSRAGLQTVYVDQIEIVHRVPPPESVRMEFDFGEAARIYRPGSVVDAELVLENLSREREHRLTAKISFHTADGKLLHEIEERVHLPKSGEQYRARHRLNISQQIVAPGLYRITAALRDPAWAKRRSIEATVAVIPSNRGLPRGKAAMFGVRSELLRVPAIDRRMEIEVARELGAHMLMLHVPVGAVITPDETIDVSTLDDIVSALVERNIAPCLSIKLGADRQEDSALPDRLLESLLKRFGRKVAFVQFVDAPLAQVERFAKAVRQQAVGTIVLTPPVSVSAPLAIEAAQLLRELPDGAALCLRTGGEPVQALSAAEAFARQHKLKLGNRTWIWHDGAPQTGNGHYTDAEDLFRAYLGAAEREWGGIIWASLRDTSSDPRAEAAKCGLVNRTFGPRVRLLGFVTAAAQLTGMKYAGRTPGVSELYDAPLLIGTDRQLAVLDPREPDELDALIQPVQGVAGTIVVTDFERRSLTPLGPEDYTVYETLPEMQFVELLLEGSQPLPQLAVTPAWLRLPSTVYYGANGEFTIHVVLPEMFNSSYLTLERPRNAPYAVEPKSHSLAGAAGKELDIAVKLRPLGESTDASFLTIRPNVEGEEFAFSVRVEPLATLRVAPESRLFSTPPVGRLAAGPAGFAEAAVHLVLDDGKLHIGLAPRDQPFHDGDALRFALAGPEMRTPILIDVRNLTADKPSVRVTCDDRVLENAVRSVSVTGPAERGARLTMVVDCAAVGISSAAETLRAAAHFRSDSGGGLLPPEDLMWGDPSDRTLLEFRRLHIGN